MNEKFDMPKHEFGKKLLLTLNDKTKYALHYRNLSLYIQLQFEVTKVHQVLKFSQHPFLKEFIDFHRNLRKEEPTLSRKIFPNFS